MSSLFQVSDSTARRIVHTLMPYVFESLSKRSLISWPTKHWDRVSVGFCGAQFLIDCTSHRRNRVHTGQALYSRGDPGYHFLTAQVITDIKGFPLHVAICLGHNNDKGVFILTDKKKDVEELNITGLCDRGYSHSQFRPDDPNLPAQLDLSPESFSSLQSKHRTPVEILNTLTKFFSFADSRVIEGPEFHSFGLMIVYFLNTLTMSNSPEWFQTGDIQLTHVSK